MTVGTLGPARLGGDPGVRKLQHALRRLGITDGAGRTLEADGIHGPRTIEAVQDLQRRLNLKADGIVSPAFLTYIRGLPRAPEAVDWDTDPIGELDEETEALIYALNELSPRATTEARLSGAAFNNAHKRGPDGKFIKMIDRIKNAITDHQKNGGKGDPLKDFNRTQLRNAAKTRGIPLVRGEPDDSIKRKLIADLRGTGTSQEPAAAPTKAAAKAPKAATTRAKKPPAPKSNPRKATPSKFDDDYEEVTPTKREQLISQLERSLATAEQDMPGYVASWKRALREAEDRGDPDNTIAYYRRSLEAAKVRPQTLAKELEEARASTDPELDEPARGTVRRGTPSVARAQAKLQGTLHPLIPAQYRKQMSTEFDRQAALATRTAMLLRSVEMPEPGYTGGTRYDDAHLVESSLALYVSGEILFTPRWHTEGEALERSVEAMASSGYKSRSDVGGVRTTLAHEYGHHVTSVALDHVGPGKASQLIKAVGEALGVPADPKATDPAAELDRIIAANASTVRLFVSGYATTNYHEFMAEVWREWSTMGKDARPAIKTIGAALQRLAEQRAFE